MDSFSIEIEGSYRPDGIREEFEHRAGQKFDSFEGKTVSGHPSTWITLDISTLQELTTILDFVQFLMSTNKIKSLRYGAEAIQDPTKEQIADFERRVRNGLETTAEEEPQEEYPNLIMFSAKGGPGRAEEFRKGYLSGYAEHGLGWIEKFVHETMPDAKLVPPFVTSSMYGNYFYEFDHWRSCRELRSLTSYQGILIDSKEFGASSWKLPNKDTTTAWYGKKYEGNSVNILCIEYGFLRWVVGTISQLIASRIHSPESFIEVHTRDGSLRGADAVGPLLVEGGLEAARSAFQAGAASLEFFFGPSEATAALTRVLPASEPAYDDFNWVRNYCESMALHFLQGHEFGHYAYQSASEPYFEEVRALVRMIAPPDGHADEDLGEEIFCDIIGLENCLFQMEFFKIPPVFPVFVPIWVLAIARGITSTGPEYGTNEGSSKLASRMQAIGQYWARRGRLSRLPAFGAAAKDAIANIRDVGFWAGQLARSAKTA